MVAVLTHSDPNAPQDLIGSNFLTVLIDQLLVNQCCRGLIVPDFDILDGGCDERIIVRHHIQKHLAVWADVGQALQGGQILSLIGCLKVTEELVQLLS